MKKTFKYILLGAAAAAALASCKTLDADLAEEPGNESREVVIRAVTGGDTKVWIDGVNLLWNDSDQLLVADGPEFIGVLSGSYIGQTFNARNVDGNFAEFVGNIQFNKTDELVAFYPPEANPRFWGSADSGCDHITLKSNRRQELSDETGLDHSQFWLFAKGTEELRFFPAVGLLKFRVAEAGINSIEVNVGTIIFNNPVSIYPTGTGQYGGLIMSDVAYDQTSTVELFPENGDSFIPDKDYYICCVPSDRIHNIKVTAWKNGLQSGLKSSASLNLKAGDLCNLGTFRFRGWYDTPMMDVDYPEMGDIEMLYRLNSILYPLECNNPLIQTGPFRIEPQIVNGTPGKNYAYGFKSSNPGVASVDQYGEVTARGIGETTITAWYPASCTDPEKAMSSHTYKVRVRYACIDGYSYRWELDEDGNLMPEAIFTNSEFDPQYDRGTGWSQKRRYEGRISYTECRIPDEIAIAGKVFQVTAVDPRALSGNTNLEVLYVGDNVTKIGFQAFANLPNLRQIHLPANLMELGDMPFANTTGITSVDDCTNSFFSFDPEYMAVYENDRYVSGKCLVLACKADGNDELVIQDGTRIIDPWAVQNISNVWTLRIPESCCYVGKPNFPLPNCRYVYVSTGLDNIVEWFTRGGNVFPGFDGLTDLSDITLFVGGQTPEEVARIRQYDAEKIAERHQMPDYPEWFRAVVFEDSRNSGIKPLTPVEDYQW